MKSASLVYAVLLAVSFLIVGNSPQSDSVLTSILFTLAGFAAVKIIFAFLLGAKFAKDDESTTVPPSSPDEPLP